MNADEWPELDMTTFDWGEGFDPATYDWGDALDPEKVVWGFNTEVGDDAEKDSPR